MEITKELQESQKLSDEQVTAINAFGKTHTDGLIADTKKEYDGKANADAEAILNGAADKIKETTGVERAQGQKMGDYIGEAWNGFSASKTAELDESKAEYEAKIKDFKGDDATKAELQKAQKSLDDAQKKYADYDALKELADKLNPLQKEHNAMTKRVAYGGVKPNFPDTVNAYEADAKWNEFISKVEKEYTIDFDGDKPIAVSKENKHKIIDLKDLVAKDETLTSLSKGRQQGGTGAKESNITIEGVPFDVPENATGQQKQEVIRTYLLTKGIAVTSPEYASAYGKYNDLIKKQQTAV